MYILSSINRDGNFFNESFSRSDYTGLKPQEAPVSSKLGSPDSRKPAAKSSPEPSPGESSGKTSSSSGTGTSGSASSESSSDDSSTLYDHDLSTYATLKTDEMSFERLESRADEASFERLTDDDGEDDENGSDQGEKPPEPKFQPLQKVYARDKDGVMYAAVVRRRLYGPQYHRQVEMGLVASKEEAAELLKEEHEPMWHYFIHYNKWNVNFDRWVPEDCVFEMTDEVKAFAERLLKEHRGLQREMQKVGVKGKKPWQTVDGAAFLREWKKRMVKVEREMKFGQYETAGDGDNAEPMDVDADSTKKSASLKKEEGKKGMWTKATLAVERKLREKSLTTKRPQSQVGAIILPFALKKVLVEQWEIISQCGNLPCLPAPVTVRQALNKYLESKNVPVNPPTAAKTDVVAKEMTGTANAGEVTEETTTTDGEKGKPEDRKEAAKSPDKSVTTAAAKAGEVTKETSTTDGEKGKPEDPDGKKEATESSDKPVTTKDTPTKEAGAKLTVSPSKSASSKDRPKDAEAESREQEWRDMADGIAMLFDEALASRLLYREETPQLRVLDSIPEYSTTPFSELYGCEHLLRLFVRLPDMLADQLTEAEARPIIAKVNDFVRFLHKNHGTLLAQSHRKLNEAELKEQQKLLKAAERKRKLRQAEVGGENEEPAAKKSRPAEN